jgi:hypothetical protein
VLTGDLNIVENSSLRSLLQCGPKFREQGIQADPLQAIRNGINDLALFLSRRHSLPLEAFALWKAQILETCEKRLSKQKQQIAAKPVLQNDMSQRYLKFLKRHLVLVQTDKAADNIAFVCKGLYCDLLRKELQENGSYELQSDSEKQIIDTHNQILGGLYLMGDKKLPYLYATPKFHKDPVTYRYIAGSGRCTTTKLSKILSDILTSTMRVLRAKDEARVAQTGIRRFFAVESGQEVADFLAKWDRAEVPLKRRGLKTGDFSTMYTSIPHKQLLQALERATSEAFAYQSMLTGIQEDELRVQWTDGGQTLNERVAFVKSSYEETHSKKSHLLSKRKLNDLIAFLVSNTFCQMGKQYTDSVLAYLWVQTALP